MIKIAVLLDSKTFPRVFSATHIAQLEQIGEVSYCSHAATMDPEVIKTSLTGADVAITSWGSPVLNEELLAVAPNLKLVVHAAGTVKGIVTPELWERGVQVSSANEALGVGVAETALGMTIASLKNMWRLSQSTRDGGWSEGKGLVREMYQVSVGVLGAGKAGRHYIRLLQQFSVNIYVYDPMLTVEEAVELGVTKVELKELMSTCDVVSIHAPSLPSTYRMINHDLLKLMKDDAILINTARGALIDEQALLEELRKGRLFACLDVTDPEPPAKDHPLRNLPNCVITPHIAGAVNNGVKRLGEFALEEIRRFQAGRALQGEVKAEHMSVLA